MMFRHSLHAVAIALGVGGTLHCPPAFALSSLQLRQLTVLQDLPVADILVDRVAWMDDEHGLVIGGWEQWPGKVKIVVAPTGGQVVALERPATSRFALSPSRREVAYWATTGGNWAQLAIVPITGGAPRYIGEPVRITRAMHLAWVSDFTLCTLTEEKGNCVALSINLATGRSKPLMQVEGGQWLGLRVWPGADPIAAWLGGQRMYFRLAPLGRTEEVSAEADRERVRPDGALYWFFDEKGALLLGGRDRQPPRVIAEDAGAACWLPDASAVLLCRKRGLWSVAVSNLEQRQVPGCALENAGLEANAPRGMSCSPDGGALAYWKQSGATGQVRRALLGLEEITVRVRFPGSVKRGTSQRLWVCTKLQFDAQGRVKEPAWKTVKAELVALRTLPGAQETIVEAVSVGANPGTLERLAGPAQAAQAAAAPAPSQLTFTPIPDLQVWLQGTAQVGEIVSVEVSRRELAVGS